MRPKGYNDDTILLKQQRLAHDLWMDVLSVEARGLGFRVSVSGLGFRVYAQGFVYGRIGPNKPKRRLAIGDTTGRNDLTVWATPEQCTLTPRGS